MQKLGARKINRLEIATVQHLGGRNFTRQRKLTSTFNYLFGISSGLDKQQFQAFANTRSLAATMKQSFTIAIIMTLLFACSSEHSTVIETYPNGEKRVEFIYKNKDDVKGNK